MLSLVTVSPVITAFYSCCLSHHVFDQVNLWPTWVGFETTIMTMLTWNRKDSTALPAAPRASKGEQGWIFWSYKSLSGLPESGPYRMFCTCLLIGIILRWGFFFNQRINFYLLRTFPPHLGSFCVVSSFTTFNEFYFYQQIETNTLVYIKEHGLIFNCPQT